MQKLHRAADRIKKELIIGLADSCVEKNTKLAVKNVRQKYESE
jgi:hypothetical protein